MGKNTSRLRSAAKAQFDIFQGMSDRPMTTAIEGTAEEQAQSLHKKQSLKNKKQPVKLLSSEEINTLEIRQPRPRTEKHKRPVELMTDEAFNEMIAKMGVAK